jgi:hypothetical protein
MSFPKQSIAFHSMRLSAMSPRTLGSMLTSANGGAGSMSRVYKWAVFKTGVSAPEFLFNNIGISKSNLARTKKFYNNYTYLNNV